MPTLGEAKEWYSPEDPVHGWDHVQRVCALGEWLARQVGADLEIVRAGALLHDVAGAAPQGGMPDAAGRPAHEHASAEFARQRLAEEGGRHPASRPCFTAFGHTASEARKRRPRSRRKCCSMRTSWTCSAPSAQRARSPTPCKLERRSTPGHPSAFCPAGARGGRSPLCLSRVLVQAAQDSWAVAHRAGARSGRERDALLTAFFDSLAAEASLAELPTTAPSPKGCQRWLVSFAAEAASLNDTRVQILLTNDDGIRSPGLWAAAERFRPWATLPWLHRANNGLAPAEACRSPRTVRSARNRSASGARPGRCTPSAAPPPRPCSMLCWN